MREKKTVFKLFFVWDFEKEERWLNEMAQEGWVLDNTGFSFYTFVRCEPGEYIIRLETNSLNQARYGWLNLLCAAMLSYALGRIHGMKAALEKQRSLHE